MIDRNDRRLPQECESDKQEAMPSLPSALRGLYPKFPPSGLRQAKEADQIKHPSRSAIDALAVSVAAHLNRSASATEAKHDLLSPRVARSFAILMLDDRHDVAERMLLRLCAGRKRYVDVADTLLAEAARYLGEQWESDAISFAKVTLVIGRLLQLRHMLRSDADPHAVRAGKGDALFVSLPNQMHTLGLVLAADAFRDEGWHVETMLGASAEAVVERAKIMRPGVIGLTAGKYERLKDVLSLADRLKDLSFSSRILLGGHASSALTNGRASGPVDYVVKDIRGALQWADSNRRGFSL
jgi:methanogenic corrinoid protein MtbC1